MAPDHRHHDHYDTQGYATDQASQAQRVMQHIPWLDRVDRTDLQDSIAGNQAEELAPEVRMGDDRVLGDTPNWAGFTSEQLYDFATKDNEPPSADNLGRSFNDGGNSLAEAANGLLDAVTRLDGAWSGVAADSARSALAPLAQVAGQAGQTAQMMGVQMARQSLAAAEVRKLPPAQEFNEQRALQAMLAGGPAAMQADLKAQKDAADAVKREQVSYLNAYTQAMAAIDAQTPSFVPPPEGSIQPGHGGDAKITASPVGYVSRHGGGEQRTSTGAPSGGFTGIAPGSGSGFADNPDGSDIGDFTLPGGLPGTSTAGFNPGGTAPVSAPSAPVGGGSGAPAAPAAGAGGFGGAFGNFGGTASGGSGAGSGAAAQPGEGARGGAGARGPVPAALAGQGAAGRGAAGMGGAAGRSQDEEDEEREKPTFLIEGDPEGTFGNDQLAAPSVIGGDEDDD